MHTMRTISGFGCRATALSLLMAGAASLGHAQQAVTSTPAAKMFLASSADSAALVAGSSSSSSSDSDSASANRQGSPSAGFDSLQPPPRRRYGRPNYSSGSMNPDGSSKFAFMAGAGLAMPIGNTHFYETPSYNFQVGAGRNYSKSVAVLFQFDYDHFGLQGATLANQKFIYNYCSPAQVLAGCTAVLTSLDGNNHVWSFTLNPTFTLPTEGSLGAYAVIGGGFYHKVTNFTVPTVVQGYDYFYGPYQYTANQTIDHYTSNAVGVSPGFGLTYKFSKFSNERFYLEARYVVDFNQKKNGYTSKNVSSAPVTATNFYPANSNRTTFIPITLGIRF
jgi:hypothetical protein